MKYNSRMLVELSFLTFLINSVVFKYVNDQFSNYLNTSSRNIETRGHSQKFKYPSTNSIKPTYNYFNNILRPLDFYQIFLSPPVKWCTIITYKHAIYGLPHGLRNNLRN